jgi:hypothetical protein
MNHVYHLKSVQLVSKHNSIAYEVIYTNGLKEQIKYFDAFSPSEIPTQLKTEEQ